MTPSNFHFDDSDWVSDWKDPILPHSVRQRRKRVRNIWLTAAILTVGGCGIAGYVWGAPAVGAVVVAMSTQEARK